MADLDSKDFNIVNSLKLTDRITLTDSATGHQFASMEVATFLEQLIKKMSVASEQENGLMSKADKTYLNKNMPSVFYGVGQQEKGILIKTDIHENTNYMFYLEIKGNSYNSLLPYHIMLQGYNYKIENKIVGTGGQSAGHNIPVQVFIMDDYLCFWLQATSMYISLIAYCYVTNSGSRLFNRITDILNVPMPTNISRSVVITPKVF